MRDWRGKNVRGLFDGNIVENAKEVNLKFQNRNWEKITKGCRGRTARKEYEEVQQRRGSEGI